MQSIATAAPNARELSFSQAPEEISTLFIVGFPEDITEREFQNMFIFSPGFEAATLKTPGPDEDPTGRRQIIGFAKFRSQMEAIEARDILTGRKVDAEKGCILKAEMAKKNLHTKRGLSIDYASSNSYSYQTHVQHYQRRYTQTSNSPGAQLPPSLYTAPPLVSSTPPPTSASSTNSTRPNYPNLPSSLPATMPSMVDYYKLIGKDTFFQSREGFARQPYPFDEPLDETPLDFLKNDREFGLPPVGFNRQNSSTATLIPPNSAFSWNNLFPRNPDM